jgi:RNA polymerase sigma factor (sigma-70 family)
VWSAEAAALVGEERREVMRALRRLPARQREALVLRYFCDLGEQEIARVIRISRGTVNRTGGMSRRRWRRWAGTARTSSTIP